jgi:hypothetical protein
VTAGARRAARVLAWCALVCALAATANAQRSVGAPRPELRLDVIGARGERGVQAGVGISRVMSTYARVGAVVGAGASRVNQQALFSARADLVARFIPDPFRVSRWSPYVGGGASARHREGAGTRVFLLLLAGVEGPEWRGWLPSLEAGYGGGLRVGAVLRRARTNWR